MLYVANTALNIDVSGFVRSQLKAHKGHPQRLYTQTWDHRGGKLPENTATEADKARLDDIVIYYITEYMTSSNIAYEITQHIHKLNIFVVTITAKNVVSPSLLNLQFVCLTFSSYRYISYLDY